MIIVSYAEYVLHKTLGGPVRIESTRSAVARLTRYQSYCKRCDVPLGAVAVGDCFLEDDDDPRLRFNQEIVKATSENLCACKWRWK